MPAKQFRSAGPMTLNNYTPEELEHIRTVVARPDSKIKYLTFNQEVGENGTPHLQIYAQAYEKLSVKAWHDQLGARISNIVPTLSQERAIKYCQGFEWNPESGKYDPKSGSSQFEEFGKPPAQGSRTDLYEARSEVLKRPLDQIMLDGDHAQTIAQHYTYFKDLDQLASSQRSFKAARTQHDAYMATRVRQPWEDLLYDILSKPACTRTIHWFVDTVGETGKTVNAKNLLFHHDAFYCTGGKSVDIAHAYKNQPVVVFNLVASQDKDTISYLYKVLEEFKDGIMSSGKYNSCLKVFPIPHVIVMSNDWPDESKMKKARIVTHDINNVQDGIYPSGVISSGTPVSSMN